jgi:hypothetical protein
MKVNIFVDISNAHYQSEKDVHILIAWIKMKKHLNEAAYWKN